MKAWATTQSCSALPSPPAENAEASTVAASGPPLILQKVLAHARLRQQAAVVVHDQFITACQQAVLDCREYNMAVNLRYQLFGERVSKTEHLDAEVAEMGRKPLNTLLLVFDFYSKLRLGPASTFEVARIHSEQMCFSEFVILCRDFNLVPRLLVREDLRYLWSSLSEKKEVKTPPPLINFDQFKDLIVRTALWTYHKPGLKKLIAVIEGFVPTAKHIIHAFCTQLRLDDEEYIHRFLRTTGRRTQGEYNFRSVGEVNEHTKRDLLADSAARQHPQLLSYQQHELHDFSTRSSSSQRRGSREPVAPHRVAYDPHHHRYRCLDEPFDPIAHLKDKPRTPPKPKFGYDLFGDKLPNIICTTAAHPMKIIRKSKDKAVKMKKSLLPPALQERLRDRRATEANGNVGPVIKVPDELMESSADEEDVQEYGEGGDLGSQSSFSSSLSAFRTSTFDSLIDCFHREYHPRLIRELSIYSYVPPQKVTTEWKQSYGPFLDLGLLQAGVEVKLEVELTNNSADVIHVDATMRNFQADDADMKTYAKPVVAGFSRVISVQFTVPNRLLTVFGSVDLACVAMRNGFTVCIHCPVFYRVDASEQKDVLPKCTGQSLPDLINLRNQQPRLYLPRFETQTERGMWRTKTNNKLYLQQSGFVSSTTGKTSMR